MQKSNFENTRPCICAMLFVGYVLASIGDSMHKTHKFDIGATEQVCENTDVNSTSCTLKRDGIIMPPTSRTTNAMHKFNSGMIENVCVTNRSVRQQGRDLQYTCAKDVDENATAAKVLLVAGVFLVVASLALFICSETMCPGDDCVSAHERLECGCPDCLRIVKDEVATVREERAKAKEEKAQAEKATLKEQEANEASEGSDVWSAQMRFKEAQPKDSTYKGQTTKAWLKKVFGCSSQVPLRSFLVGPSVSFNVDTSTSVKTSKSSSGMARNSSGMRSTQSTVKRLPVYQGPNPFGRRIQPGGRWEQIKLVFFTVTLIAPIKVVLILLLALSMGFWAKVTMIGHDGKTPIQGIRKLPSILLRLQARILLFLTGLYWVNVRGRYDGSARILVANHVSIFDAIHIYVMTGSCEAAMHPLFKIPVVGTFLRGQQCIAVNRDTPEGREKARVQMLDRCTNAKWPPILVFPQGTVAREDMLTTFKNGAFENGVPVQPIALSYMRNRWNSLEFTEDGMFMAIYRPCCQFINFQTITFLPPHVPNEDEVANAGVFAEHVRRDIAEALGASLTPHSYDDCRLRREMKESRLGKERGDPDFLMVDIFSSFKVPTSKVIALVKVYENFDRNSCGDMDFDDFCSSVGLEPSNLTATRIFNLLDVHKNEVIDFEGFVTMFFRITTEGYEKEMLKVLWCLVTSEDGDIAKGDGFEAVAGFFDAIGASASGQLPDLAGQTRELGKKAPQASMETFTKFQEALKSHQQETRDLLKSILALQIPGMGAVMGMENNISK